MAILSNADILAALRVQHCEENAVDTYRWINDLADLAKELSQENEELKLDLANSAAEVTQLRNRIELMSSGYHNIRGELGKLTKRVEEIGFSATLKEKS